MTYHTILIVEDEATLRRVIATNLRARDHEVIEAESAEQALTCLAASPPDLMLLDINLPDRSGWDILRELRLQRVAVPTVIISAVHVTPARLAEFRPLAYLPKPFPLDALLRLVEGDQGSKKEEAV
jgi:DNA-binding response OmpR family regulator